TAPARAVHARKRELPLQELERQLAAWRTEARRSGYPVLDASGAPAETCAQARTLVEETPARRHGDLGPARAALELLGSPSRAGTRPRMKRRHRTTRRVIPAGAAHVAAG